MMGLDTFHGLSLPDGTSHVLNEIRHHPGDASLFFGGRGQKPQKMGCIVEINHIELVKTGQEMFQGNNVGLQFKINVIMVLSVKLGSRFPSQASFAS